MKRKIYIKYGILTYLGLMAYLGIMMLFGLHEHVELRVLNIIIIAFGVYQSIKKNKMESEGGYVENLFHGFLTVAVAVFLFAVSTIVYLNWINPDFMEVVSAATMWGKLLTPQHIAFAIFFEGIASGFIISFAIMQYLKGVKFNKKVKLQH